MKNHQELIQLAKELSEIAENLEGIAPMIKDTEHEAIVSSVLKGHVSELNKIALHLIFDIGLKESPETAT